MSELNKESVEQAGGDERAAFEVWASPLGWKLSPDQNNCGIVVAERYGHPGVQRCWEAWQARAALAQPSPAQAEKAEVERTEGSADLLAIVREAVAGAYNEWKMISEAVTEIMEAHERIVGELRADRDLWAEQAEQRLADWDEMRKERDAALARVAELERQEPVALANRGLHAFWVKWTEAAAGLYGPGIKLYAAPVAQAQQLNDLDKQCRDDVARALGLRPNQERGFAWSYLLASIKSCVKASEDSAQAQHSVPGDIMRDAQRYRWLRDQQFYFSFSTENSDAGISSCTAGMSSRFKNLSWVDAAIDSAIAAAPGKEGV